MDVTTVKKPTVQPAQAAKRPEQVQRSQTSEVKPKEAERPKAAEVKPKPVVNTQGQTTGRLLNVTA
jgi:hypothetical protein